MPGQTVTFVNNCLTGMLGGAKDSALRDRIRLLRDAFLTTQLLCLGYPVIAFNSTR